MADNLTKDQRSKTMARIRRRDTKPELLLRKALWARGLRGYRLDDRRLPGRPDLAWTRKKVAVFIDGAFWHGHPSAFTHGKSGAYWDEKIARNIERDRLADAALQQMGWTVFRFWDFEVRKECERCVDEVEAALGATVAEPRPRSADSAQPTRSGLPQPRSRAARKTLTRA